MPASPLNINSEKHFASLLALLYCYLPPSWCCLVSFGCLVWLHHVCLTLYKNMPNCLKLILNVSLRNMYIVNARTSLKCLRIVFVLLWTWWWTWFFKTSVAYGVILLCIWTFWYWHLKLSSLPSEVENLRIRHSAWTKSRRDSRCLDLQAPVSYTNFGQNNPNPLKHSGNVYYHLL